MKKPMKRKMNEGDSGRPKKKRMEKKRLNSRQTSVPQTMQGEDKDGAEGAGKGEGKTSESAVDMAGWKNLYVPESILRALSEEGFSTPMPIQARVLPHAIRDQLDIVGAAETGSGKTLAFGIPLLDKIIKMKGNVGKEATREEQKMGTQQKQRDRKNNKKKDNISDENAGDMSFEGQEVHDLNMELAAANFDNVNLTAAPEEFDSFEADDDEEDGDVDRPPDEEEEEISEDMADDSVGCVRVVHDVQFDWLNQTSAGDPSADDLRPLYGLVLAPTRELAMQVYNHLVKIARFTGVKAALIVGGMAAQKQQRLLKRCPEIVVATPGRLWELIQEGEPHLNKVKDVSCLVIDEADRMVEKGHFAELASLLEMINDDQSKTRKRRQTFVFSATLTLVHGGPNRYMKKKKEAVTSKEKLESLMYMVGMKEKAKVIDMSEKTGMAQSLIEARINCSVEDKDVYLYMMLKQHPGRTIVFANSKDCVRRLVSVLTLLQCRPLTLHADMHQKQRLKNLDRFKCDVNGLLLATDVAARGLDIQGVQHVIHFQVPRTSENYVHRSGRTARANKEGISIMLIGPDELQNYRKIIKTLKKDKDIPTFPFDDDYLPAFKERVYLARQIDKDEHKVKQKKNQNNWFLRAAKEVDIDLDEDEYLHDMGDSQEQAKQKQRIAAWKAQLKQMLAQPCMPMRFSGKYPTKSGRLIIPGMREATPGGAVTAIKSQLQKNKTEKSIDSQAIQAIKRRNKAKAKKKQFKKR